MRLLIAFAMLMVTMLAQAEKVNESTEEERQQQQVEAIRQYERSGHREPLGGGRERLGNPLQPIPTTHTKMNADSSPSASHMTGRNGDSFF